jgi:hypothetical protein
MQKYVLDRVCMRVCVSNAYGSVQVGAFHHILQFLIRPLANFLCQTKQLGPRSFYRHGIAQILELQSFSQSLTTQITVFCNNVS